MIANKLTGAKGVQFTAQYVDRFHEMEKALQQPKALTRKELALLVIEAEEEIERLNETIEEQAPKVRFAECVEASTNSVLVKQLASILTQSGYKIGQNKLFDWLRDNDYLCKAGSRKNMPYQRYVEQGLFEVTASVQLSTSGSKTRYTTKVTHKGVLYFTELFTGK